MAAANSRVWSGQGTYLGNAGLVFAVGFEPCSECKGGLTSFTFRYTGATPAAVEVQDKHGAVLFPSQTLNPGDIFSLAGTGKDGKLADEIRILVNGSEQSSLRTNCSEPIGPGKTLGDFTVVSAASKDGGEVCPLCSAGVEAPKLKKNAVEWSVTNYADDTITVSNLSITWPVENGVLTKVKLGGKTIFEGSIAAPAAEISSGWAGDVKDRQIGKGKTEKLQLEFADGVGGAVNNYTLWINFAESCSACRADF